jgi:hypothetical protein
VDPGFGVGCRVAIDNNIAVVGSVLTGDVRLYDVTTGEAFPILNQPFNTMLSGIGAIAVRALGPFGARQSNVAVGEYVNDFQARVKLINYSGNPSVIATAQVPLTNVSVTVKIVVPFIWPSVATSLTNQIVVRFVYFFT